jgi:hypothetical protein
MQIIRELVSTGAKEDWSANCSRIGVLEYNWDTGRQEVQRMEEELDKDALSHRLYST